MGRVLCSIVDDTWAGTIRSPATTTPPLPARSTAHRPIKKKRNEWVRNPQDNLLTEAQRWGMGLRDLGPSINFFSKVVGASGWRDGVRRRTTRKRATSVTLRAEMNTLILLDTGQHALDPNPVYAPKPVQHRRVRKASPPVPDDPCRLSCAGERPRLHQHGKLLRMSSYVPEQAVHSETVLAGDGWIHPDPRRAGLPHRRSGRQSGR